MADDEVVTEEVKETPEVAVAEPELPLEAEAETPEEVVAEPEKAIEEPVIEETKPDWKDRELKKKHAQIMEARRVLAERDAELERLRAGKPAEQNGNPQEVEARAREIVAQERYIESCNAANESGQKAYKAEWKSAVETLEQLGGFDIPTMRGIMATGAPDKALYLLGTQPDEYHRIMDMPIERRIVEITKLVEKPVVAPKKVSEAPAPIRTVGGTAAPAKVELNDKMSDDEWYAAAKAQRAKKFAAQGRR
jgi:hypothetical protein